MINCPPSLALKDDDSTTRLDESTAKRHSSESASASPQLRKTSMLMNTKLLCAARGEDNPIVCALIGQYLLDQLLLLALFCFVALFVVSGLWLPSGNVPLLFCQLDHAQKILHLFGPRREVGMSRQFNAT